jgi:hypothetical protein
MSDFTLAASAKAFEQMFTLVRDNLRVSKADNGTWGPFSWSYAIQFHLNKGDIQLNNDDTVEIRHLDVVWDQLKFQVCFNLPGFCVGGWCIIPDPFDNCWVSLPKVCVGGPICLPIDLSGLVSEIEDLKANLVPKYFVDPARPPGVSDLTAEFLNKSNEWRVFLNPVFVDVLPINVPATIENLIETVFKKAIENAFSWIPDWAWSLLWDVLGPLLDLLKFILGILEDIQNWVEDLLNKIFNLVALIETLVTDYFASQYPLFKLEDPYPILDGQPSHNPIPVKIPLRDLGSHVNSKEMVVTADIGA